MLNNLDKQLLRANDVDVLWQPDQIWFNILLMDPEYVFDHIAEAASDA